MNLLIIQTGFSSACFKRIINHKHSNENNENFITPFFKLFFNS